MSSNWLFETGTYGVSAALLDAAFEAINNTVFDFEPSGGVLWVVAFEPLPTAITQHGAGKNVLGISPSDGNAIGKSSLLILAAPSKRTS